MPRVVNVGAMQINTVNNYSLVTIGDSGIGDVLSHKKLNVGFGMIYGCGNLVPASCNLILDPDVFDHNGNQLQVIPNVSNTTTIE